MTLQAFDWSNSGALDAAAMQAALDADGAFLMRGMLSEDEIVTAREQVRAELMQGGRRLSLGRTKPNAAILAPSVNWVVSHPKIVDVFKSLLGDETSFTGHCDIHMNMLSGWHKDSGEHVGGYFKGDYFAAPDCRVYKAAVYLQDAGKRDGLTVRLGSHRSRSHDGYEIQVPSRRGDVVFFDVRLSHTGQRPDLIENGIKALTRLLKGRDGQDPLWATNFKSLYWNAIGRRERLSIFFTYGARNAFTRDFAAANMLRQNSQTGAAQIGFPKPLLAALEAQNVRVEAAAA